MPRKLTWDELAPSSKYALFTRGDERVPPGWTPPRAKPAAIDTNQAQPEPPAQPKARKWTPLDPEVKAQRLEQQRIKEEEARRRYLELERKKAEPTVTKSYQHPESYVVDLSQIPPNISEQEVWAILARNWDQIGISPVTVTFRVGNRVILTMDNPTFRSGRLPERVYTV